MAITIGQGQAQFGRKLKTRYLALALLGGLAIGALVAGGLVGEFDSGSNSLNGSAVSPGSRIQISALSDERSITYYIVSTVEQADYVYWSENEAANERASAGVFGNESVFRVVFVTTPEEADAAMTQIASDMAVEDGRAVDYRITDARNFQVPPVN